MSFSFPNTASHSDNNGQQLTDAARAANEAILKASDMICDNIRQLQNNPGLLSQNTLAVCRTLTEDLALRYYAEKPQKSGQPAQGRYDVIQSAVALIRTSGSTTERQRFKILNKFHSLLQITNSHYIQDADGSERLMLKYLNYLYDLREMAREDFGLDILSNLEQFPLSQDANDYAYYEAAAKEIKRLEQSGEPLHLESQQFYILRKKPFFIKGKRYFEIQYAPCSTNGQKSGRRTAYTALNLPDYHATKLSLHQGMVKIFDNDCSIHIIKGFMVSILPSELGLLNLLVNGVYHKLGQNQQSYKALMDRLTTLRCSLRDLIVDSTEQEFSEFLSDTGLDKLAVFKGTFAKARDVVLSQGPGARVISYLLLRLRGSVLRSQINKKFEEGSGVSYVPNPALSNLYLTKRCIPFDTMPLCTSLPGHNPFFEDLLYTIDFTGRECELMARAIKQQSTQNRQMFHEIEVLCKDWNITPAEFNARIDKYNKALYEGHKKERKLKTFDKYVYFNGHIEGCKSIFSALTEYAKTGIDGWQAIAKQHLSSIPSDISDEKRQALLTLFDGTHLKLVYGAAGTGKTTFMKTAAEMLADWNKYFFAVTHTAVDNLRRRITTAKSTFMTLESALSSRKKPDLNNAVLFVDECGCICNRDMVKLLSTYHPSCLVLAGDDLQIESIEFGNWFAIAKGFLPTQAYCSLNVTFRSTDPGLLKVWESVRNADESALAALVANGMSGKLDESLFQRRCKDEIILCLGYDGIYGINNINRYLQEANQNPAYRLNLTTYKVGDPIVFTDNALYTPTLYNNLKGVITQITVVNGGLNFEIETDVVLMPPPSGIYPQGLTVRIVTDEGGLERTRVSFTVLEAISEEQEQEESECEVPFQIAYAISVHKAQGLEYESVKLIVSDNLAACVTLNLFYTAITRSKHFLKVYWSKKAEQQVLDSLRQRNFGRDVKLLKNLPSE